MGNTVILIIFLTFTTQLKAQNIELKTTSKVGKCLAASFDYNKKFEWIEVDCSKVDSNKKEKTRKQLIKKEQKRLKFVKYQEKLISLGYKIDVNGILDSKTIKAHNKYLKKKEKAERRQRKIDRKKTISN